MFTYADFFEFLEKIGFKVECGSFFGFRGFRHESILQKLKKKDSSMT